jgi:hypothetical protein
MNITKLPSGRANAAECKENIVNIHAPSGTAKRTGREYFYNGVTYAARAKDGGSICLPLAHTAYAK